MDTRPRDERAVIWGRLENEKHMPRIPPLPPVWINGEGDTSGHEAKTPPTGAQRVGACGATGQPGTRQRSCRKRQGVAITSPLPKKAIYRRGSTSLDEAQGSSRASSKRHA